MAAGLLVMGADVVEVSTVAAGSSVLILKLIVLGSAGGSSTFMLEKRYLVGVGGNWWY